MAERIVLGVDPGTIIMGYGLIRVNGQKAELMALGVIQLDKLEDHYLRLKRIFDRISGLIEEYAPDELAIEAPFLKALISRCIFCILLILSSFGQK